MSSRKSNLERPANDVEASEDAMLGITLAATSGEARPLSKGLEGKLMDSFRTSRGRVGASTTAAGTQTVDLDDVLRAPAPVHEHFFSRRVGRLAAAAVVLLAVGAATVSRLGTPGTGAGSGTEAPSVTLARSASGALVVRASSGEAKTIWIHVERAPGTFETLGSMSLGIEATVPPELASRLGDTRRARLTEGPDSKKVLFDGPIPPGQPK
jgi:hypothetical protein